MVLIDTAMGFASDRHGMEYRLAVTTNARMPCDHLIERKRIYHEYFCARRENSIYQVKISSNVVAT